MSGKGNKGGGSRRDNYPRDNSGGGRGNRFQERERQVSDQQSSGYSQPGGSRGGHNFQQRHDGPRNNQGQAGGGGGGFGGGSRGGPPSNPNVEFRADANPYTKQKDLKPYITGNKWKPFFEQKNEVVLHQRPAKPGTWKAREITASVNHFPIEGIPKLLYLYQVNSQLFREGQQQGQDPPQPRRVPKDLVEAILKWLVPRLRQESGHHAIATDFSSKLYTTKRLEELGLNYEYRYTVVQLKQHRVIEQDIADERDESRYVVNFQFANEGGIRGVIDTSPILDYLRQHHTLKGFLFSAEQKQTLEAAINAFIKNIPTFPFYSVGRSTIVPLNAAKENLGEGLLGWKGCSMSAAMGWKPFINLEISNAALLKGINVLESLKELLKVRDISAVTDMNRLSGQLDKVKTFLKTTKIQYRVAGLRYTKAVRDVFDFGANHESTRFTYNDREVTVYEYYNLRYNIRLTYPNGPLLVTSNNAKIPAELCFIKEGQSVNRKLTGSQTDKMLKFARKDANVHYQDIQNQFTQLNLNNSSIVSELGIQIPNTGMLKIQNARVLVAPTLRYGAGREGAAHFSPTHGMWEIWRQQGNFNFYQNPQRVEKWGVLVVGCSEAFDDERNYEFLQKFIQMLERQGASKGVSIAGRPSVEEFNYSCRNREEAAMDNRAILKDIFEKKFKECTFVLVVFPEKGDPLYGHVKHVSEVDVGILTQCVQLKSVVGNERRPGSSPSLVQNVLLKLNMKLGGINHVTVAPLDRTLATQFCTLLMDCPVMVLGADVTHPPPGSRRLFKGKNNKGEEEWFAPSYAAVTGSLDKTCMPFNTEIRAQRKAGAGAAEVIQDLEAIVKKMLRFFWENSKRTLLPLKIIYFRDGVGEGQFKEVLFEEMRAIRNACRNGVPPSVVGPITGSSVYEPRITFITVQKRHKTRIFWHDGPNVKNAPAGTVIDQEIVHPTEIDFYLLSHYGALGTSRPSRYHVLWDDSDFSLDELQSLAYTLCYMFARCTKSVKMPAPTYYAHLAADRAKKLCEGFENKFGEANLVNLNRMLTRETGFFWRRHPMHFI